MKKIICPTDFSTVANNAVEYAAQVAKAANAELEMIHLEFLSPASPVYSGLEASKNVASSTELLKKMCADIHDTFHINCHYKVEAVSDSIEYILSEAAAEDTLIVMGTNGMDDLYQDIFGTNTYQVLKKAKAPVLVIPEGAVYKPVNKIALAWDYSCNSKGSYLQVKEMFRVFKPEMTLLHVSSEKTVVSDEVYSAMKEDVYSCLGTDENVSFARIYCEDPNAFADHMDEYMSEQDAELLAITFYDRGKLKNIFHGTIIKELSEIAWYPLLILHQEI